MTPKLQIHYDQTTDTLSLWNGAPVASSHEIHPNLLIELDAHRTPVGFTLEHALEQLRPHLPNLISGKTPNPAPESRRAPQSKNPRRP